MKDIYYRHKTICLFFIGGGNMQDFAKSFYHSSKWLRVRDYVKTRAYGLCEICGRPGVIAHHKIVLTAENVTNPEITLNTDLLVFCCQNCHNKIHGINTGEERQATFDANGNLIGCQTVDYTQYIIDE